MDRRRKALEKREEERMYHIGVISDTHGLLREEVRAELRSCDAILHGGDVDRESILEELRKIAPLYAVRGNVDKEWAKDLPIYLKVELFGIHIKMVHNKKDLPETSGDTDLVVFGHSHKYLDETKGRIRFLNPGSCGPKRFRLPVTMAMIDVDEKGIHNIRKIDMALAGNEAKKSEQEENAMITPGNAKNAVTMPEAKQDHRKLVKAVIRDVDKGRTVEQIARNHHLDTELAEQICRMYLTHPGVDVDGILNRIS